MRVGTKHIIITSEGEEEVVLSGKTLQLSAGIIGTTVTWTVENGTGKASIDGKGLLTAASAGKITVKAVSNDGSGVTGIKEITIAKPLTINGFSGSDLEIVIPEKLKVVK